MQITSNLSIRSITTWLIAFMAVNAGFAVTRISQGNFSYELEDQEFTASVIGLASGLKTVANPVIPSEIEYEGTFYTVTSIKELAFQNRVVGAEDKLTGSLTLPASLKTIGRSSFYNSVKLIGTLVIPNDVIEIDETAFNKCSGFSNLELGNSLVTIGEDAFNGCTGMTGLLRIPNSVKFIGSRAFYECYGLSSLELGNSIKSIGNNAFYKCTALSGTLIIPNSLTELGGGAFSYCSSLEKLEIGSSLKTIQNYTFNYCTGLKGNLNIPNNIEEIGWGAFTGCTGLSGNLELPNAITKIDGQAFLECSGFTGSLKIPDSVTFIGMGAFAQCTGLIGDLIIGDGVTIIGDGAFTSYPVGFSGTLTIGESVQQIGEKAFFQTYFKEIISLPKNPPIIIPTNYEQAYEGPFENGTYNTVPLYVSSSSLNLYKDADYWKRFKNIYQIKDETISISINVEEIILLVGQSDKLIATVMPENTTDMAVIWTSDNEAIAKVASDGTVTAVSVGVANITATCGSVSATCNVTVNPVTATSIELSLEDVTLLIGSTTTLTAKVYPENTTNQHITWTSSNPSIATIDERGTITALQVGEAIVTATCGELSAMCKVTVTPVSPSSIDLNIKDMIIYIGQNETIQAIVRPSNTTYPTVTWRSDDETVATVSADGRVTGIKEGVTTITATCGEVAASCKVTVNPIPASNIEIVTGDVTLTIGSTTDLIVKVSPDNTTHPDVEWSSSDINIATIDANGKVNAVNIGTAIITAKCGNVSATCTATVIPVPSEGVVISPTSISMLLGDEATLAATVFPENTTNKTVTWGSDNPGVASVSSMGVVTALSLGTATITASNGNSKATCLVTVNPVVATSISLNVKDETIFVASATQLVATISPANVTDKTITWSSSKPEIAAVSEQGIVSGVAVGTTTVTAICGDVSASCQINVVHRIPDMAPSVTTSNRDISTISGRPVKMAIYAEGGEPTGWSFVWIKSGEVISRSNELNITALNETETVIADTYRVKVENEIDKVVILSEVFDFVVRIYPAIDELPDDGGISVTNGTGNNVSKTREGNTITLSASTPAGGNPQGWEFAWKDANGNIGEEETVETVAGISSGNVMSVEQSCYYLEITNYSPEGDIWGQFNFDTTIDVYRRPQTPVQMLRKGDGTSNTFVAMMPIIDAEFERLEYKLVYGWTDSDGEDHIIEQTNLRYCHVNAEVYNNSSNKFWVYSIWNYQDGSVVSSGLRYLDGGVDESFDASVFDSTVERNDMNVKARSAVCTIAGQYMGADPSRLTPGIYIYIYEKDGEMKTEKIFIR